MNEKEWVIKEIMSLQNVPQSYEVSAFLKELELVVIEQYKRIEQAEAEIDGILWSPTEW